MAAEPSQLIDDRTGGVRNGELPESGARSASDVRSWTGAGWVSGGWAGGASTIVLAMLFTLAGCVPPDMGRPQPQPPVTRPPAPAPSAPVPAPAPAPAPTPETEAPGSLEPVPPMRLPRTVPPVGPASRTLLTQSREHQAAGRYELAAASIERALRIEPRQPVLWLELGEIRLQEGNYAQAESIGRKALSLAAGDDVLMDRAEALIGQARKR